MGLVDHRWLLVKGAQDASDMVTLLIAALRLLRTRCASSALSIPRGYRYRGAIDTAGRYRYRTLRATHALRGTDTVHGTLSTAALPTAALCIPPRFPYRRALLIAALPLSPRPYTSALSLPQRYPYRRAIHNSALRIPPYSPLRSSYRDALLTAAMFIPPHSPFRGALLTAAISFSRY